MRFLIAALALMLLPDLAVGEPRRGAPDTRRASASADADRFRIGAETHWSPGRFADRLRLGLGVGWRVPRRWYDADGSLLTERSLLQPGHDLERPGLYLALRF